MEQINKSKLKEASDILNQLKGLSSNRKDSKPKAKQSNGSIINKMRKLENEKPKPSAPVQSQAPPTKSAIKEIKQLKPIKSKKPAKPATSTHTTKPNAEMIKQIKAQENAAAQTAANNRRAQVAKYKRINDKMINHIEKDEAEKEKQRFMQFIDTATDSFIDKAQLYHFASRLSPEYYVFGSKF